MNRYFADINERDEAHQRASELNGKLTGGIVTTQWVLTEVADALVAPESRPLLAELLDILTSDPDTVVVEASPELFDKGVELFKSRPDKYWSLTDCISFVVMEEFELGEALTADHHFEQAGFRVMLK